MSGGEVKIHMHLTNVKNALLAARAVEAAFEDLQGKPIRHCMLIEFENGQRFQVYRNLKSMSVWDS